MLEFIISGFLFTWVAGLFLPLLLRFVILKRPIGKFLAIFLVSIVYFVQFVIATELNPERKSHAPLFLVAWVAYLILRKDLTKKELEDKTPNQANNTEGSQDSSSEFSIKTILSKKYFNFWLFFIATGFSFIAIFSNSGKNRTLEDIMNAQNSWLPSFNLGNDFANLFLIYVFCVSLYFALLKYKESNLNTAFIFIVLAIIFNPFFIFHFGYNLRGILNLVLVIFFGYLAYREYSSLILNENKILAEYHSMNAPLKLITQVQYPEMKHLFDKIDALAKQKIESN